MKISTLELRFYDNIKRCLKYNDDTASYEWDDDNKYFNIIQKDGSRVTNRNFHEYYIDGKGLINHVGQAYWSNPNPIRYFDDFVGQIGSFSLFWDFMAINELQLNTLSEQEIVDKFIELNPSRRDKNNATMIKFALEQLTFEQSDKTKLLLYCCAHCGDEGCGGMDVEISKSELYYDWDFGDDKLKFRFERSQYENYLNNFFENQLKEHYKTLNSNEAKN